jgi:hypothetical protein
MPKTNKLKLRRSRSDGMYVFISAFAIFGSFILLGSYADRNPTAGSTSGTYTLSDFATNSPNSYTFSMKAGLSYCFPDMSFTVGQQATLKAQNGSTVQTAITQAPNQPPCFTAPQTYSKVTVTLPTVPSQNELIVQ